MKTTENHANGAARGNLLLIAALVALTAVYLLAFYFPHRKQMAKLEAELALKRQAVQSTALAEQTARVERRIQQSSDYLKQRRDQIRPVDAARLFGKISSIAAQARVRTTRFEPSPAIQYEHVVQLPLAIDCDGSFQQLFDLVGEIERLPQLLWINNLKIQPGKAGSRELQCQINLAVFADKSKISD